MKTVREMTRTKIFLGLKWMPMMKTPAATRSVKKLTTVAILGCLFVATVGTAEKLILFQDTFNRANSTNLNASTSGKSGSLGALSWTTASSADSPFISNGELQMGDSASAGGYKTAYLGGHNFIDSVITTGGGGFSITMDMRATTFNGGVRFVGFSVGNSLTDLSNWGANNPTNFTSDFFFGYDPTGVVSEIKIFIGGVEVFQQEALLSGGAELSVEFTGFADFNVGRTVTYRAFVDGLLVDTGTFNWSATNENYLQLYSNIAGDGGLIDNFTVATVAPCDTYANWIGGFSGLGGQTALDDDPDGDGSDNGTENYFGTHPGEFSRGLVSGNVSGSTMTFTHPLNESPACDLSAAYRWSKDLSVFHADGASFEGSTVSFSQSTPVNGMVTVTATITGTALDKLFVDIEVTQP